MAKFNLNELLSQRSRGEETGEQEEIHMIDVEELDPSEENFYQVDKGLKWSIEFLGVIQPLIVKEKEDGRYLVLAGHRRRLAVLALLEEGKEEFRSVPCVFQKTYNNQREDLMERLILISANQYRNKTDWERMTEAVEAVKLGRELKQRDDLEEKSRTIAARITGRSETQIGRYQAIYKNLSDELMEHFRNNRINVTVAEKASALPEEWQHRAGEMIREAGNLTIKDVDVLRQQEKESRQIPGPITFEEVQQEEQGNDFTGRREAEKTEEQRYNEEQDRIDRETRKILQERQQEERMAKLPSQEERKIRELRIAAMDYREIADGRKAFELTRSDHYRVGELLEMIEYFNGRPTTRKIEAQITYVQENWKGIEEGYCILGFMIKKAD